MVKEKRDKNVLIKKHMYQFTPQLEQNKKKRLHRDGPNFYFYFHSDHYVLFALVIYRRVLPHYWSLNTTWKLLQDEPHGHLRTCPRLLNKKNHRDNTNHQKNDQSHCMMLKQNKKDELAEKKKTNVNYIH